MSFIRRLNGILTAKVIEEARREAERDPLGLALRVQVDALEEARRSVEHVEASEGHLRDEIAKLRAKAERHGRMAEQSVGFGDTGGALRALELQASLEAQCARLETEIDGIQANRRDLTQMVRELSEHVDKFQEFYAAAKRGEAGGIDLNAAVADAHTLFERACDAAGEFQLHAAELMQLAGAMGEKFPRAQIDPAQIDERLAQLQAASA